MSTPHHHAVIWIDHREARVFHFSATEVDKLVLQPLNPTHQIHHKANAIGSGHAPEDQQYLHAVALAIANAGAVLITGPANAKAELVKHIHHHDPKLMDIIVGVETVDHPMMHGSSILPESISSPPIECCRKRAESLKGGRAPVPGSAQMESSA